MEKALHALRLTNALVTRDDTEVGSENRGQ